MAFHASMKTYDDNREIAAATQVTRSILNRLADNIRRAAAIDLSTGNNEVRILCPDDESGSTRELRFIYESEGNLLRFQEYTDSSLTEDQILLGDNDDMEVTNFYVYIEQGLDGEGLTCAKKVQITLGFKSGSQSFSIQSSASPRRNQDF
jgi:hypothetical protein